MSTLTVRLPDDKHERLKSMAQYRKISVNKLVEELTTQALADFDIETRFRALAATGNVKKGLKLLDKLDDHFRG
jgi:predicted DNA-binding ribbon-helix-helix protein